MDRPDRRSRRHVRRPLPGAGSPHNSHHSGTKRSAPMTTNLDEIAPDIYRISTLVPDIGPTGLTFNQFLLVDDDPLLFHTGHRSMFASVREAIERVVPLERLRWITFGHVESDECGAMNEFLAAAPSAEVAHGAIGCMVSLDDLCDRPPR